MRRSASASNPNTGARYHGVNVLILTVRVSVAFPVPYMVRRSLRLPLPRVLNLSRLSGMLRSCSSNSCTTRRGMRHTTVRQAMSAVNFGRDGPALLGAVAPVPSAAFRTDGILALIFIDMRFDRWQFGHLMPPRLTLRGHLAR